MKELRNNTLATFPQIRITKIPGKAQTGKNVMQDGKPMYKRKDGKVVKRGIWSNSYLSNRKQEGGDVEQQQPDLMSLFSWFAENVPDDDFNSPEDVAKEFQQLSPEQQQQFVASIQQQMGTMQYGGMSINASPTKKYQEGGMDEISMLGYSDDSPYRDYEMLPIDSNYLTMENTGIPLMGVGNQSGEIQYMNPYSGDYYFPNDEDVTEYPLAQTGGKTMLEKLLQNPEVVELTNLRQNKQAGYTGNTKRLIELENKYGSDLTKASKLERRLERQIETGKQPVPKSSTVKPNNINQQYELAKKAREMNTSVVTRPGVQPLSDLSNYGTRGSINVVENSRIPIGDLSNYGTKGEFISGKVITKPKLIPLSDLSNYGSPTNLSEADWDIKEATSKSSEMKKIVEAKKIQAIKKAQAEYQQSLNPKLATKESIANSFVKPTNKLATAESIRESFLPSTTKNNLPNFNFKRLGKSTLKGLGYIGAALQAYDIYDDLTKINDPNYVLTDRGMMSKEDFNFEQPNQINNSFIPQSSISNGVNYNRIFGNSNVSTSLAQPERIVESNTTPSYSGNVVTPEVRKPKYTFPKKQTQTSPIDYGGFYDTEGWNYDEESPIPVQEYRDSYMNMGDRSPNFTTPNQISQKLNNTISTANSAQKTVDSFAGSMNDISNLDPKIFKRNEQGKIIESPDADWDKIIDLSKSNPFEYAPMLQNYANALNQDPQYRATANIKGAFTPELDVRGAIQAIDDELKDSMRNVDMNSTAGAAIAAQLQANASKNKLNVINDAAQKNAQIRGQNSQSEANRQNQQNQLQQQYDAQYYDNILRSRSASDQEKNKALNALLSRKEQKDAMETNLAVATMPYNNFKYKPGEGVFRNNKVEFYTKEIEAKKAEEEKKKVNTQIGGWGNKFKFKNI